MYKIIHHSFCQLYWEKKTLPTLPRVSRSSSIVRGPIKCLPETLWISQYHGVKRFKGVSSIEPPLSKKTPDSRIAKVNFIQSSCKPECASLRQTSERFTPLGILRTALKPSVSYCSDASWWSLSMRTWRWEASASQETVRPTVAAIPARSVNSQEWSTNCRRIFFQKNFSFSYEKIISLI